MADHDTQTRPNSVNIDYISYGETGLRVAVRSGVVSKVIREKIQNGRYERWEAATVPKILERDEVFLELGAGVGVISSLAWMTGKVRSVHCFEADPRLIPLIEATHAANGVRGEAHNVILTSEPTLISRGVMDFYVREHFYGSSVNASVGRAVAETVAIPVRALSDAVSAVQATVIACDIEGAEQTLFRNASIPSVRRIMVETHQTALGGVGMRDLFDDLHRAGFHYDQTFSRGSVPVFSRI
jgi:FkbM family methyltransferase